jgi:hypothetical protein
MKMDVDTLYKMDVDTITSTTKENKERCTFFMEDIQRYGVSTIF